MGDVIYKDKRGSVIIELSQISLVIFPIFILISVYSLLWFTRFWISQNLYDSLICLADQRPKSICKRHLKKNIIQTIKWGNIEKIELKKNTYFFTGNIEWKYRDYTIKVKKKLSQNEVEKKIRGF